MSDKALNTFTIGQGKFVPSDHTGPASYTTGGETLGNANNMTGISVLGLGSLDYVDACDFTISGNYQLLVQPTGTGERKTFNLVWVASAFGTGVAGIVQNAAGVGMTPGLNVPIVFAGGGGSGAAGNVTVLTATTISIKITNTGKGYTSAPTATISGTGGTPATLTVTTTTAGAQPAAGVNLSGETVRLVYVGR